MNNATSPASKKTTDRCGICYGAGQYQNGTYWDSREDRELNHYEICDCCAAGRRLRKGGR